MPEVEIRVWCENGDLVGIFDDFDDALKARHAAIKHDLDTHGELPEGVMSRYGYSLQVLEDGLDISADVGWRFDIDTDPEFID